MTTTTTTPTISRDSLDDLTALLGMRARAEQRTRCVEQRAALATTRARAEEDRAAAQERHAMALTALESAQAQAALGVADVDVEGCQAQLEAAAKDIAAAETALAEMGVKDSALDAQIATLVQQDEEAIRRVGTAQIAALLEAATREHERAAARLAEGTRRHEQAIAARTDAQTLSSLGLSATTAQDADRAVQQAADECASAQAHTDHLAALVADLETAHQAAQQADAERAAHQRAAEVDALTAARTALVERVNRARVAFYAALCDVRAFNLDHGLVHARPRAGFTPADSYSPPHLTNEHGEAVLPAPDALVAPIDWLGDGLGNGWREVERLPILRAVPEWIERERQRWGTAAEAEQTPRSARGRRAS